MAYVNNSSYDNLYVLMAVTNVKDLLDGRLLEYYNTFSDNLFSRIKNSSDDDIFDFIEYYNAKVLFSIDMIDYEEYYVLFGKFIQDIFMMSVVKDMFDLYTYIVEIHASNINYIRTSNRFSSLSIDLYYPEGFLSFLNSYYFSIDVKKYSKYLDFIEDMDIGLNKSVYTKLFFNGDNILVNCDMYKVMIDRFSFVDITSDFIDEEDREYNICMKSFNNEVFKFSISGYVYKMSSDCRNVEYTNFIRSRKMLNIKQANKYYNEFLVKYFGIYDFILRNEKYVYTNTKDIFDKYINLFKGNYDILESIRFLNEFFDYILKTKPIELTTFNIRNTMFFKFTDKNYAKMIKFLALE
jgi:hypothetical protein